MGYKKRKLEELPVGTVLAEELLKAKPYGKAFLDAYFSAPRIDFDGGIHYGPMRDAWKEAVRNSLGGRCDMEYLAQKIKDFDSSKSPCLESSLVIHHTAKKHYRFSSFHPAAKLETRKKQKDLVDRDLATCVVLCDTHHKSVHKVHSKKKRSVKESANNL